MDALHVTHCQSVISILLQGKICDEIEADAKIAGIYVGGGRGRTLKQDPRKVPLSILPINTFSFSASLYNISLRRIPNYERIMSGLSFFPSIIRRSIPWTCRACLRRQALPQQRRTFATKPPTHPTTQNKRRRRILLASSGLGFTAAAITFNEDAKHAYTAVQRSSRVVTTLFININEYVIQDASSTLYRSIGAN